MINALLENFSPLRTSDVGFNRFERLSDIHSGQFHRGGELDVAGKFLVSLMVSVIERTPFKLNHTSEPVEVSNSSGSCNLCSETVASNSSHGDLVFVHPADNVCTHLVHVVRIVVVGVALIPVVQQPDVSNGCDFVVRACEEGLKILCILNQLR